MEMIDAYSIQHPIPKPREDLEPLWLKNGSRDTHDPVRLILGTLIHVDLEHWRARSNLADVAPPSK